MLTSAHSSLLPASIVDIFFFSDVFVVITLVKEWKGNVSCVDVSRAGGSPWGTAGGGTVEATELIISPPYMYFVLLSLCVTYVGLYDIASLLRSEDNLWEVGSLLPYMGSGD